MTEIRGQLSIFDFLYEKANCKPGEYIDKAYLGPELSFGEVTLEVGNLIVIDCSTESYEWYKVVMVEKIHIYENGTRRLIYYDGKRQRGLVNEMYFDKIRRFPVRAWKLINGEL